MVIHSPDIYVKIGAGIDRAANCIKVTAGPFGRNIAFDPVIDNPYIVNSGKQIIKYIKSGDGSENIGIEIVRQAMEQAYWRAGDGTATTAILIHSLWTEGLKAINAGADSMGIMRGIKKAGTSAIQVIKENADISTDEDIYGLAKSAGGGRDDIAALVKDVYSIVGPDGYVAVEDSQLTKTEIIFHEGIRWEQGYSGYYKGTIVFEKPLILLINKIMDDVRIVLPILEYAGNIKRPVLIVAREMKDDVKNALHYVHANSGINVISVEPPGHGEVRDFIMKSFGIMLGAKVYDDVILSGETITAEGCGTADHVTVSAKETVFQGVPNSKAAFIIGNIESLKTKLCEVKSNDERFRIEQMIMSISENCAEIKVGGTTEMEMFEQKYLVENAIRSTFSAVKSGILPGGGKAYLLAVPALKELKKQLIGDEAIGVEIVRQALCVPALEIANNAGINGLQSVFQALETTGKYTGYNVVTQCCEDLRCAGILDSAKTVESVLETAISAVAMVLSVDAGIVG